MHARSRARLGYGAGDDLVAGRWRAAYALPSLAARAGAAQMLAPQQQLAAILSGRSAGRIASEDLALRARLDLEQGRARQAALQLRAAIDALEAELAAARATRNSRAISHPRSKATSSPQRPLGASSTPSSLYADRVARRDRASAPAAPPRGELAPRSAKPGSTPQGRVRVAAGQ